MFSVRQQVLIGALRRSFGEEPGELAPHVLALGESANVRFPRLECRIANGRLAAMVEHEMRVGALRHQLHDLAELIVGRTQIERQAAAADGAYAIDECEAKAEPIRFALNVVTNSF